MLTAPPRRHTRRTPSALLLLLAAALLLAPRLARADDTEELAKLKKLCQLEDFVRKSRVWKTTADDFAKTYAPIGFEWTSTEKRTARASHDHLRFLEFGVVEALVYFDEKGIAERLTLNLYNRGDVGDVRADALDRYITKISDAISEWAKARPRDLADFAKSGIDKDARLWVQAHLALQLEWSETDERAEYLRLQIFQPDENGNVNLLQKKPKTIYASQLRDNIDKQANGDVHIANIPMVDQGQKGYCAVAVMERVLRYYGREVDQHEIAKIAGSENGGTDPEALKKALSRYGSDLGVSIKTLEDFDFKDFKKTLRDYNRIADKAGKPEINLPDQGVIYLDRVFMAMDPVVLGEARHKSSVAYANFQKDIKTNVDKGIPLEWGVMLGLIPEKEIPQAAGGHLRLIIGYNQKTDEILYSDTWGRGHELKRMLAKDAWTMTTALYAMTPK